MKAHMKKSLIIKILLCILFVEKVHPSTLPAPAIKTCKTQQECIGVLCKNNAIGAKCVNGVCVCGDGPDRQNAVVICNPEDPELCKDATCPPGKKPRCSRYAFGQGEQDIICVCE